VQKHIFINFAILSYICDQVTVQLGKALTIKMWVQTLQKLHFAYQNISSKSSVKDLLCVSKLISIGLAIGEVGDFCYELNAVETLHRESHQTSHRC